MAKPQINKSTLISLMLHLFIGIALLIFSNTTNVLVPSRSDGVEVSLVSMPNQTVEPYTPPIKAQTAPIKTLDTPADINVKQNNKPVPAPKPKVETPKPIVKPIPTPTPAPVQATPQPTKVQTKVKPINKKAQIKEVKINNSIPFNLYHIKNRENKALFDKKGIYNKLITDYYEIYLFSINEIIVQEMFKDRSLVSNIKKIESGYVENLKILIVGFNDLSEEILYNILKLGHFDLDKITEVTVIDDNYELLNSKYKTIIKRGKEPYENNNNKSLWKLEFLPYKCLYEDRGYNRIILCDKELNNGLDILNYINNNYHVQIKEKNTIIQVFNEHKNINDTINNRDENNFKNFSTFGDIETTVTLDNIKNNNLYKVAEYTNDFKETDESKKWINIDSFTIESNITEKLHMNIKLNHFDLKINTSSRNNKLDDLTNSYYKEKKQELLNILKDYIEIDQFKKLPKVFDNFIKNYKDEKFELFDNIKLDYNLCNKIEQKFNNGLDLKITIEDLFKIIDYDKDKEELSIKIKKLKTKL